MRFIGAMGAIGLAVVGLNYDSTPAMMLAIFIFWLLHKEGA